MSLLFAADLHLGHKNAIKWRSQFSCVEEMDQTIIDNWNAKVNKQDTVFVLGDVAWNYTALDILGSLKGKKKLVLGNHDEMKTEAYMKYFTHIYGAYQWNHKILLSHVPVHPMNMDRFRANIHGHTHSHNVMGHVEDFDVNQTPGEDSSYINVSMEQINYTPISWDEIQQKHGI